ncbi:hypothetical protein wVul_1025 [Wolbachia endosymbiont of Armadillidium vulgare str. wVulC]|uniref:hypothetical protein n=1 Tax=Wolbachia endosymbiont of Armadillidium vulgare TaxID=77039 RepID=UPI000649A82A|nr:hypothetical protein [Wolbachia endosymbiont of Armadillidium vulgare]KLT22660.1 hypothetical protein wVul_1025 [Wolbachia endosymbiont of Armadillidium vulgare str. wVulC]OJH32805.1 hypothetical protein Wxf_02264 [Wolbachia endosymbiont of Armadillidium vulgare]
MAENDNNDSFTKRFTNRTPDNTGEGFSSKYSSQNTKERALGAKGKISELASKKAEAKEAFSESGGIKSKSRTINERSFADATRRSRSDLIYLVRGKDRGRSAWHYVLIDKEKREMFLAKSRTGSIDVADYGEILYSGWGEDPPQAIVDKINEEFGL